MFPLPCQYSKQLYIGAWVKSAPNHLVESSDKRPSSCMATKSLSTSAFSVAVGRDDDLSNAAARSSEYTGEPSFTTGNPSAILAFTTVSEVTYPTKSSRPAAMAWAHS